jgi:hypothetical protein
MGGGILALQSSRQSCRMSLLFGFGWAMRLTLTESLSLIRVIYSQAFHQNVEGQSLDYFESRFNGTKHGDLCK